MTGSADRAAPPTGVVGLGLIGGSILRGLSRCDWPVGGWDPDPRVRGEARRSGLVVSDTLVQALAGRELVVVAVPPAAAAPVAIEALARTPQATVCDVCSVKGPVLAAVSERAGADAARFVGGHPLAGSERGGFAASHADLFADASWAVCPGDAALAAILVTTRLVEALDAQTLVLSAGRHDEAVARSSHAPHVMAGVMARLAAGFPAAALSGGALRDSTRVAGSDPGLWSEILQTNGGLVASVLLEAEQELGRVRAALERGDGDALRGALEGGATARASILRARWAPPQWEARQIRHTLWRETLVGLGDRGLRVRGLRVADERLCFEVAQDSGEAAGP